MCHLVVHMRIYYEINFSSGCVCFSSLNERSNRITGLSIHPMRFVGINNNEHVNWYQRFLFTECLISKMDRYCLFDDILIHWSVQIFGEAKHKYPEMYIVFTLTHVITCHSNIHDIVQTIFFSAWVSRFGKTQIQQIILDSIELICSNRQWLLNNKNGIYFAAILIFIYWSYVHFRCVFV